MNKRILLNQLLSIQSQVQCALDLLLDEEPKCDHERKEDHSVMGGGKHWVCKDCGYEHREDD